MLYTIKRDVVGEYRREKRAKKLRNFWRGWGLPLMWALLLFPFVYAFMVVLIITLQSLTGEWNAINIHY